MIPPLTVRQVMQSEVITVEPGCSIDVVLGLMNLHRIGAVVVVRSDGSPAGIFTERDLLRRVGTAAPGWTSLPVSDWMSPDPHTIGPDVGLGAAVETMERRQIRHIPVVESGRVVGLISPRLFVAHREEYLNRMVEDRTRELRQAHDLLLARDAEITYHLRAAGRFQTRLLLPHAPPDWAELRWGVHYQPLDHLGGDYYDTARPDPDHLGFLIADASGHSIAAAMVAILSRSAFAEAAGRTTSPGEVLAAMNHQLQGLADERFVTAFYGVLNRRTREFRYATAGHPPPLRYAARTGELHPLAGRGFMLGIVPGEVYREQAVVLEPGDRVCFYTDGVTEARNEIGEAFGTDRLHASLIACGTEPAGATAERVLASLHEFRGSHPFTDDVTLLVAELRE